MTERGQALSVILAVTERHAYLKDALEQELGSGKAEHRSYIGKVTRGVIERLIELDTRLNAITAKNIKRLHPVVRGILRLGTYELLYMDSIPPSASVNEAVKLAKAKGQARAAGMVNAVLRRVADAPLPDFVITDPDTAASLSVRYSMPEWIVGLWLKQFGSEQTKEMLAASLAERALTIRVNLSRGPVEELLQCFEAKGIRASRIPDKPMALSLPMGTNITALPGYPEGWFYVQDISSMSVCLMADIHLGEHVLDLCASPGGKSLHAADLTGSDGLVEARDLTPQKLERIEENQRRCGFSQIRTKAADATVPDPACVEQFDVVLVDAPCSGLGVLGRKPEIKYRVKPEDIEQLAVIQGQILTAAASYVKKGGRLVYSTCTLSDAENSGQIRQFVKTHPQYRISREELLLPQTGLPGNDGFYICVMNRAPAIESVRRKNKNRTASR